MGDFTTSDKAVKVTIYAEPGDLMGAALAAKFAIANSDFSGGFAIIDRGSDRYAVKRNKASFSVWPQVSPSPTQPEEG